MIKEYIKKDGTKAYMFVAYLGIDPITGKQKRTTRRGFKTKREAKIAEAKLHNEIDVNGFVNNENLTFEQVYQLWYEQYQLSVRESTLHRTTNQFTKQILPRFAHLKIATISSAYCQKVINEWYQTLKSAKNIHSYTKQIFLYAVKMKIIKENPMDIVETPRTESDILDPDSLYYTKEELQVFLNHLRDEPIYQMMFRLLAFTGMRRGELLALTWEDVDFINHTLSINKTLAFGKHNRPYVGPPKTKKSIRTISVDHSTIQLLQAWKIKQRELLFTFGNHPKKSDQLIFSNLETNRFFDQSRLTRKIGEVSRKHDFKKIKVHGFRHTHCSLLFESGATIQEVQNRLGHTNIKTTMDVYAHVTKKQKDKMAEQFAAYMNF